MTLMLCASLCCSSVMAAEKDASEATFGPLPNINKLKPEQERVKLSFVGGHDVDPPPPPATAASSVTVVVKELAKANASNWLWQITVALGRSNSFKLQQSTRLQGSQRLSLVNGARQARLCTN